MLKQTIIMVALVGMAATTASAQAKGEFSFFGGYTTSEGFQVDPVVIGGTIYDKVDPNSGGSFGLTGAVLVTENVGLEFRWSRQGSELLATGGANELAIADMNIDNYHVNFVYHWGAVNAPVRPFFFGGLGATSYDPGTLNAAAVPAGGASGELEGETRFSTIWGGGIKAYGNRMVGVRAAVTWTPTYIKSDPAGVWCSPYYCWVVGDSDYSNQLEFSAGVTFRFGR